MSVNQLDKYMEMSLVELDDENYFNNAQNIVRVKVDDKDGTDSRVRYFDIPLLATGEYPNPAKHFVLVFMNDSIFTNSKYAMFPGSSNLNYIPGYSDENTLSNIADKTYCMLINKGIKNNTTNYSVNDSTNFNKNVTIPSNTKDIRYSFSPPLDMDYTTTNDKYVGDKNLDNIGLFITDDAVILKSSGGQIVLGPDGVSILGNTSTTASTGSTGVMGLNPIGTIVPETMMSFPAAIKYVPNIDFIMAIGNNVNRAAKLGMTVGTAAGQVVNLL